MGDWRKNRSVKVYFFLNINFLYINKDEVGNLRARAEKMRQDFQLRTIRAPSVMSSKSREQNKYYGEK